MAALDQRLSEVSLTLKGERSLLQSAYDRAGRVGEIAYVVIEAGHAHFVKEQLPELPDDIFLIEPGRRGTGNCIVFALDVIGRTLDHDEPIAFVHSDHSIRDVDGYARSLQLAAKASQETNKVTLIGIEPTFPSTGFGYIERDGELGTTGAYNIESFKEKPDYETAVEYLKAGRYLWNCGYFVGSVNTFMNEMERSAPDLQANYNLLAAISEHGSTEYNDAYLALDNQVIDIALIEKAQSLAVVSASFDWMDIGNFKDLHDVVPKDEDGNYIKGDNVHTIEIENVYIRNEEPDKPIAVIGLDNVVVVNTPDGILVARKDVAAKSGDIAKKLQ